MVVVIGRGLPIECLEAVSNFCSPLKLFGRDSAVQLTQQSAYLRFAVNRSAAAPRCLA